MKRLIRRFWWLLAFLAAPMLAQPPIDRGVKVYTVATAPSCSNGSPYVYIVTDAASGASCTVSGGSTEVHCQCMDGVRSVVGSGSSGSSVALDLGNNGSDESSALVRIAVSGDTNSVFSEPSADKFLIDVSKRWPSCDAATTATTATTATALASNPADCSASNFSVAIAANGDLTCAQPAFSDLSGAASDSQIPNTITIDHATSADTATSATLAATASDLSCTNCIGGTEIDESALAAVPTASALATNGSNCSSGQYPLGVDASGAAEGCTADGPATYAASVSAGGPATTATALAANGSNCSAGNYPLGVDASGNAESCTAAATGGIGGSVGSTDNAVPRADGTGGSTLQSSGLVVGDVASNVVPVSATSGNAIKITVQNRTVGGSGGTGIVFGAESSGENAVIRGGYTTSGSIPMVYVLSGSLGDAAWGAGTSFVSTTGEIGISVNPLDPRTYYARMGSAGIGLASGAGFYWYAVSPGPGTVDTKIERGAAGVAKLTSALRLTPLASPPESCAAGTEGDIYSDTSHALCYCDSATWNVVSGAGSCS